MKSTWVSSIVLLAIVHIELQSVDAFYPPLPSPFSSSWPCIRQSEQRQGFAAPPATGMTTGFGLDMQRRKSRTSDATTTAPHAWLGKKSTRLETLSFPSSLSYERVIAGASSSSLRLFSSIDGTIESADGNGNNEDDDDDNFVQADDFEALQALFAKYCDADGLLTKSKCMEIPMIADLLASGDLLPTEFADIYDGAPKFPDAALDAVTGLAVTRSTSYSNDPSQQPRIDVDSFVQVYRDIDDLFEDEDSDDDKSGENQISTPIEKAATVSTTAATTTSKATNENVARNTQRSKDDDVDDDEVTVAIDDDDDDDESLEAELETIYDSLCDKAGLVSQTQLRAWDEIAKLLSEGLLGDDEFNALWDATDKAPSTIGGIEEKLDVNGFLSFNVALDDLFVFDDDEILAMDDIVIPKSVYENDSDNQDDSNLDARTTVASPTSGPRMIDGTDLSPDVLFIALANENGLIGMDELKRWGELQQMLVDGDVLESELASMFSAAVPKSELDRTKVGEEGFVALYNSIDNLFEDDNEASDKEPMTLTNGEGWSAESTVSRKDELLDAIADLNGEGVLPCGLEATELEQREILSIVALMEAEPTNVIRTKQGAIAPHELNGNWELLYSSSSAMKFNKGLSGLGGSVPNGRFGNLKQKLVATKLLTDVEYVERIEMNPSSASFDVTVTGTWDLRTSISLFTGEPSMVMNVVPDRVMYGPTSTRADHWKSLGPLNMLDITYLDADLRIMRGNTSVDTIFVFRRT